MRYIIGITLITIGLIVIRALSNGKILRKHQYAFWLIIPICMIILPIVNYGIPAAIEKADSLSSSDAETTTYETAGTIPEYVMVNGEQIKTHEFGDQYMYHELLKDLDLKAERDQYKAMKEASSSNDQSYRFSWFTCAYSSVTAFLLIALAVYNIGFISYCRRKRDYIGRDPVSGVKIYSIRHKSAPFLLFNKIYVDKDLGKVSEYAICHEACHYKHGDHVWVLVRYIVLILNWYNPVIWAAFILSGRDCELACDEEVLHTRGKSSSASYVNALLETLKQNSDKRLGFTFSTGMRSGYKMMKKRIINIKKPANNSRKALALTLAAVIAVSGCSMIVPEPSGSDIASITTVKENAASGTEASADTENSSTEEVIEDQKEIVNTFPASYKNTIGNCTFDIDKLECPEEVVFHRSTAKIMDADFRKFAEDTLAGKPLEENEETGEFYSMDMDGKYTYSFGTLASSLSMTKYAIDYLSSVNWDFESDRYNMDKYTQPKTFAFGSAEECMEKAANTLGKYGIDIKTGMSVDIYYLDHEILAKEEDMSDLAVKGGKARKWTSDDDAYLYVFKPSVQGITLSPTNCFLWPGSFHDMSDVGFIMIINKDGIDTIEPWSDYCSFDMSPVTEKLLTFDELSKNISDYLTFKSGSSKYTVTKAKLFATHDYLNDKTDSKPVELYWAVFVKENNNGTVTEYELRFDAKTGEIATRFVD